MKYVALLVSSSNSLLSHPKLSSQAPHFKRLTEEGMSGKMQTLIPISTRDEYISLLPLLGYDPGLYYTGEGSLLAARAGVHLEKEDVAFCCDLVTLRHPQEGYAFQKLGPKIIMENLPFDALSDEEGKELAREINEQVGTETMVFYPVKNTCHLMVWVGGKTKIQSRLPQELIGKPIFSHLPKGEGAATLVRCMEVASQFLQQHPLNEERISQGRPPANGIWISRPGKVMELPAWEDLYDLRSTLIADDELIQGIGQLAGFAHVENKESRGLSAKDQCLSKAKAVIKSLAAHDFTFIYLPLDKIEKNGMEALQAVDQLFLGMVLEALDKNSKWKVLFMECTPFAEFPVPATAAPMEKEFSFLISSPGLRGQSGLVLNDGLQLMPLFIKGGAWR